MERKLASIRTITDITIERIIKEINMVEKYTKKPVVVEAIQYQGYMTDEIKNFIGDSLISESRWGDEGGPVGYFIKTLEGTSYMLDKNDWVIKGVKGEFYPCKPDVFEMTYNKTFIK